MLQPSISKKLFNVLAVEQVSKKQLVLVDSPFRNNQSQGPLDFVIQSKSFKHLHIPR
jgi:predicted proteasome-type protease